MAQLILVRPTHAHEIMTQFSYANPRLCNQNPTGENNVGVRCVLAIIIFFFLGIVVFLSLPLCFSLIMNDICARGRCNSQRVDIQLAVLASRVIILNRNRLRNPVAQPLRQCLTHLCNGKPRNRTWAWRELNRTREQHVRMEFPLSN